jgi:hypothetical protein
MYTKNITFVVADDELEFLSFWFGPSAPQNSWALQPSGPFNDVPVCAPGFYVVLLAVTLLESVVDHN